MQTRTVDFLIVGLGAAGLSAASYAARAGLVTVGLEQMAPGGQMMTIDNIENYPGFGEGVSGFVLAEKFEQQATNFGAEIAYEEVQSIEKDSELFKVATNETVYEAKAVLIATGASHRLLGVKGEEEYTGRGVSYCATCDGPFFKNKKILVVGGGDSAVQECLYLNSITKDLKIIHRRDEFRAQAKIVEKLKQNEDIKISLNTTLKEIKGDGKKVTSVVFHDVKTGVDSEEDFDAVFIFVGILPNSSLAKSLGAKVDESGYIVTNENMETSIKGLYAAGDVRATVFRQVVTACSDGAVAAHKAHEFIKE